jgi:hypothetical protein
MGQNSIKLWCGTHGLNLYLCCWVSHGKNCPKSRFQRKQIPNLPNLYDKFKLVANNTKGFNFFSIFLYSLSLLVYFEMLLKKKFNTRILKYIRYQNCCLIKKIFSKLNIKNNEWWITNNNFLVLLLQVSLFRIAL